MCLAQGPQRSEAGEVQTCGPSVSSQALNHWATVLQNMVRLRNKKIILLYLIEKLWGVTAIEIVKNCTRINT